jgi:hypothetical protein
MDIQVIRRELWTPQEDKLLTELWPNHTAAEISHIMQRCLRGIKTRARRALNLPLKARLYPVQYWKPEEDEVLKSLWLRREVAVPEIARQLGRSRNAIIGRAHRLAIGMRSRPPHNSYQMEPNKPRKPRVRKKHPVNFSSRGVKTPPSLPEPLPEITNPGPGVPFLETSYGQCRAIISSSHDRYTNTMCCGRPIPWESNLWFCREHLARYTVPGRR